MVLLAFTLPPDSGEKLTLGRRSVFDPAAPQALTQAPQAPTQAPQALTQAPPAPTQAHQALFKAFSPASTRGPVDQTLSFSVVQLLSCYFPQLLR